MKIFFKKSTDALSTAKRVAALILYFLVFVTCSSFAKAVAVEYIGEKPLKGDTTKYINVFHKFDWDVKIIHANGEITQAETMRPDSLFKTSDLDTVYFSTSFSLAPQLINQVYAIDFAIEGSIVVRLNGDTILVTGSFVADPANNFSHIILENYKPFIFRDTMQKLEITYLPRKRTRIFDLTLNISQLKYAEKTRLDQIKDKDASYQMGFYYLAFGIAFLFFFIFFREKTENLYFSLFCITIALSVLWHTFNSDLLHNFHFFLVAFSFEFLSIFFKKVIKNKEKSKISLIVIVLITSICLLPAIRYHFTTFFGFGQPESYIVIFISTTLIVYTIFSSLFFLIQGIGQKRWEAKVILSICAAPICLFLILALSVGISGNKAFADKSDPILDGLIKVVIYIYPLSAVIILGRRNGLNQKKLITQVQSIRLLSEENLAKEQEKQQLLEGQNTRLEQKVLERTTEVRRQKEIIEIKNKAITDNLNYAQRIQSAILPDIKLIYKALEQSFILYLPKDIVSGDFYAFAEKERHVLIIGGDCTGHGVSGAFMSMIGSSLLNQIINEKGIAHPALILNQLNSMVIETLKQTENESNDGMDISICSFDLVRNKLEYAGANRPLWLVRNGEIIILKPDKFPIGGLQAARNRIFTNHTLQLEKQDAVYIFTDGFADQFGGVNGKKLMTRKFKELLLSIQNRPMRDQEIFLKEYFEHWKGENEQVDDVLVIGIRV